MSYSPFRGKGNQNLLVLRDILITYSAYHQGIVQVTLITDLPKRYSLRWPNTVLSCSC